MKSTKQSLALVAATGIVLGLTACGDDVTKVTEGATVTAVETEASLPECNTDNNGSFVIAKDKQKVFVCYSENWFSLNSDGSPADSAKTTPKSTDGKNGANGTNGTNGTSCTGVAFESGDSTGFKIVCGKDTLGVILNGKDGINGRSGRHAVVPGLAQTLAKRMKRGVNVTAFASEGAKFKGFNDNGMESSWCLLKDEKTCDNFDRMEKKHFKMIADKGFDHIRFQVNWTYQFAGDSAKCEINPEYMKQIRWAVENTNAAGMIAVVDEHDLLMKMEQTNDNATANGVTYAKASPCEKKIYRQIIDEMKDISPDSLIIELPNEPTKDEFITKKQWGDLVDSLIQIVHGQDPARVIIVGARYNYNREYLNELDLDNSDGLLMASFHYYEPFEFTTDCGSSKPPAETCGNGVWSGSGSKRKQIYEDFKKVSDWSKAKGNIPVYLGEYGVIFYVKDTESVEKWLTAIVQIADQFGFATAMHNFGGNYYIYHFDTDKWVDYKLRPLFNPKYQMAINPGDYDLSSLTPTTIENFESASYPTNAYFSKDWWSYAENVENMVDFTVNSFGYGDSKGVRVKLDVLSPGGENYPSFGLGIDVPSSRKDMSSVKAISFYAKGSGTLKVAIPTSYADSVRSKVTGKWVGDFAAEVTLTSDWRQYVIWNDDIAPERYSYLEELGADWSDQGNRVTQFSFRQGSDITPTTTATVVWYIDDIKFYR